MREASKRQKGLDYHSLFRNRQELSVSDIHSVNFARDVPLDQFIRDFGNRREGRLVVKFRVGLFDRHSSETQGGNASFSADSHLSRLNFLFDLTASKSCGSHN